MIKNDSANKKNTYMVREFGQNLQGDSLARKEILSESLSGRVGAISEIDTINYIMGKIKENNLRDLIERRDISDINKRSEKRKKI